MSSFIKDILSPEKRIEIIIGPKTGEIPF